MPLLNYADAEPQINYDIIPDKTLAKVRMTIKHGGYNDETKGWTDGFATKKENTGSVYLDTEFTVIEGPYANRKVWSLIGLHSMKGERYAKIGKSFIRGIIESAYYIDPEDKSATANKVRSIDSFAELDGIIFAAKIDVETDKEGKEKNKINFAITKGHKEYINIMGEKPKDNGRYKIGGDKKAEPVSNIEDDPLPF